MYPMCSALPPSSGARPRKAAEDLRNLQIHQNECGANAETINSTVSALRFFYTVTLRRRNLARSLVATRRPNKVREVLSVEEAAPGIKYKAALGVAYGAGLSPKTESELATTAQPRADDRQGP